MSCCGGKRTALRNSLPTRSTNKHAAAAPAEQVRPGAVTLRYLARSPIQVIGSVTRADAEALLASGYFRLEA